MHDVTLCYIFPGSSVSLSLSLSQTQRLVDEGDIDAARMEFQTSFNYRLKGWIWCAVVSPLLLIVLAVGLVFLILAGLEGWSLNF